MYNKINSIRERLLVSIDTEFKQVKKNIFNNAENKECNEIFIEFNESFSGLQSESLADFSNDQSHSNNRYSDLSYSTTQSDSTHEPLNSISTKTKRKESLTHLKNICSKMSIELSEKKHSAHIYFNRTNVRAIY